MSNRHTYPAAQSLIDRYGSFAGEYTYRMMRFSLDVDDPQAAGIWLALGNAVEQLQHLAPLGTVH